MTWSEFVADVREHLTVHNRRLGIQVFIERHIKNGVRDIQEHAPYYQAGHETVYLPADLALVGFASVGAMPDQANPISLEIQDVGEDCRCHAQEYFLWPNEHVRDLLCGNVSLGRCKFFVAIDEHGRTFTAYPAIEPCRQIVLTWDGYLDDGVTDDDLVPYDAHVVQAVAYWVLWKLAPEIDKNPLTAASSRETYMTERRKVIRISKDRVRFRRETASPNEAHMGCAVPDLAECPCTPSFDCVEGECVDPGDGTGTYATLEECQTACAAVPAESFDCVEGECVDPGDGTGEFATLEQCQAGCGGETVAESYNCVQGECVDPGDGTGEFNTLEECQAGCGGEPAAVSYNCVQGGNVLVAASASREDVEAAVALAVTGDTVQIPAGTSTWTQTLTIDKAITLEGAGIGSTNILDGVIGGGLDGTEAVFRWVTLAGLPSRMTGIEIRASRTSHFLSGAVQLRGLSQLFRLDHCKFVSLTNENILVGGGVCGVIDHCDFVLTEHLVRAVMFKNGYGFGGVNGDGSWENAVDWGGPGAIYVEDCTMSKVGGGGFMYGCIDGWMSFDTTSLIYPAWETTAPKAADVCVQGAQWRFTTT